MTRITNADQVLLLLRAHLQRMERARKEGKSSAGARDVRQRPLERVQSLAGAAMLSESDIFRALISGVLEEEFGPAMAIDPQFQFLVDDVLQIIRQDAEGAKLLEKAVAHLVAAKA